MLVAQRRALASLLRTTNCKAVMSSSSKAPAALLEGTRDVYEGIKEESVDQSLLVKKKLKVTSSANPCGRAELGERLAASVASWRSSGVRGCWVEIRLADAEWVPECAAHGFVFHHARDDLVVMVAWLQATPNQLPRYPFTNVGVGGMVRDAEGRVLLMRERRGRYLGWKFPGGLVDPGEELEAGCEREVEEETGVKVRALGVLTWRHSHEATPYPKCGDLYFLVLAEPVGAPPFEPKPCALEAADAKWFTREEVEALDPDANVSALNLWALELAERYQEAGFPAASVRHAYDDLLRGRKWNAHHLQFNAQPAKPSSRVKTLPDPTHSANL